MEYIYGFSHDNIVDVLSTATYGSDWLGIHVADDDKSKALKAQAETKYDCCEDIWAFVLEHGGRLDCYDNYDDKKMTINMDDYTKGFNVFKESCKGDYKDLMNDDGDYITANNLMQCVMFGEVIYG